MDPIPSWQNRTPDHNPTNSGDHVAGVPVEPKSSAITTLDLSSVHLYSMRPFAVPQEIRKHADDLNLPRNILLPLLELLAAGEPRSFQRILRDNTEFVVISDRAGSLEQTPEAETALYFLGGGGSVLKLAIAIRPQGRSVWRIIRPSTITRPDPAVASCTKSPGARASVAAMLGSM